MNTITPGTDFSASSRRRRTEVPGITGLCMVHNPLQWKSVVIATFHQCYRFLSLSGVAAVVTVFPQGKKTKFHVEDSVLRQCGGLSHQLGSTAA